MKDLTIIIPSFNTSCRLADTLQSIRGQLSIIDFEILIFDNISVDGFGSVVARFFDLPISSFVEADSGMYSAISKGLSQAKGFYHCYINCGDLFDPFFFDVVSHLPRTSPKTWYMGLPGSRNDTGHLTSVRSHFFTSQRLILAGYHNGFYNHFLQQESIFWHYSLSQQLDLSTLSTFRLAGDAYIWRTFASLAPPQLLSFSFSSYRHHPNPLSANRDLYLHEFYKIYPRRIKPLCLLLFLLSKILRVFESSAFLLSRTLA